MGWSYDVDALSTSDKDVVRLIIGDTDTNDQLLQNEEINHFISLHGTVVRAATESARAIAAKFARLMSRSVGGLQADFAAKYRQYLELANNLAMNEEVEPVSPYLSGYLYSQHKTRAENSDRIPIFGRKGVTDNPAADADGDTDHFREYYYR
jgi:hypothetical protein